MANIIWNYGFDDEVATDHIWFRAKNEGDSLQIMHEKISKQIDYIFSRIKYLTDIKDERNGNTILNNLMRDAYRRSCLYQIKERINHILEDLTSLYTSVANRSVALDVLVQGEAIKEMMNVWDEFFFACAQMKPMSFVYEQQTIIKLYKQALESSRKREKSLRQVQRKLYAQLITCASKSDNDYRQCIQSNRSLFALETLKCEKSAFATEKVVAVASGSVRTADEQNMKRCNNDHVIGIKHPSNNTSRIPKLSKPVNNAPVREKMANKSAIPLSGFPNANQGRLNAGKCSTVRRKDSGNNLQLLPRVSSKEQILKKCNESVNDKHPSKGIIEIPMQCKPGKKHRTAQKPGSSGCNKDVIREDTSNNNATLMKNNGKNRAIIRSDKGNNNADVGENNGNNRVIVIEDNGTYNAIVKEDNGHSKKVICEQSLVDAGEPSHTKYLKLDIGNGHVSSKIGHNSKTSIDMNNVCLDTGILNSQIELRREGAKLIDCLLTPVSETRLKRKRNDESTECARSLLLTPSYDSETPLKKARLEHVRIYNQPTVGGHSEILLNGCVDHKVKHQNTQSRSKIPRPIQKQEVPYVFDVISYLKGMVDELLMK